jgi:hypothetical protein
MTSACELKFDDMSIAEQKAYVPDEFIYLFQESDRRVVRRTGEDNEEDELEVAYFARRAVILHRLDLGGYTAERARLEFETWLESEREKHAEYEDWGTPVANALAQFNYEEWQSRVLDVLATRFDFSRPADEFYDEIDRQMRGHDQEWLFYSGGDILPALRGMLVERQPARFVDRRASRCVTTQSAATWGHFETPPRIVAAAGPPSKPTSGAHWRRSPVRTSPTPSRKSIYPSPAKVLASHREHGAKKFRAFMSQLVWSTTTRNKLRPCNRLAAPAVMRILIYPVKYSRHFLCPSGACARRVAPKE